MRGARLARAACRSAARSLTANHFSHAPSGEASPRPRPSRRAPGPQSSGTFRPGPVLQQGRSRGFFRLGSTRRCRGLAPPNRFILPSPARPARVSAGGGPGAGTEPACVDPNPRASNSPSAIPAPAPACPGVAERGERQVGARAAVCRRCGTLRRIRVRRHLGFACLSSSSCSFFSSLCLSSSHYDHRSQPTEQFVRRAPATQQSVDKRANAPLERSPPSEFGFAPHSIDL